MANFDQFEVCGYRSDLWDIYMWEQYSNNHDPITFDEWYKMTLDWMNRKTKKSPYVGLLHRYSVKELLDNYNG